MGQSAAGCAVLFQDASFTWVAAEGGAVVSRAQGDTATQVLMFSFNLVCTMGMFSRVPEQEWAPLNRQE